MKNFGLDCSSRTVTVTVMVAAVRRSDVRLEMKGRMAEVERNQRLQQFSQRR